MNIKNTTVLCAALLGCGAMAFAGDPGTAKWTPLVTGDAISGSPAAGPNGTIYITSEDGYLYAIDPATGQLPASWSQPIYLGNIRGYNGGGTELIASPAVASDGTIYVASTDHNLYSVNPNGSINWSEAMPQAQANSVGSVAFGPNGRVYVTYDDGSSLAAINPAAASGQRVKWALDLNPAIGLVFIDSPPTVGSDGTIYLYGDANGGETLCAVVDEGCRGALKWHTELGFEEEDNDFHSGLVLDNAGRILAPYGPGSHSLQAFDTSNGLPAGSFGPFTPPAGASLVSSPAIAADGTIYVTATDGKLYALRSDGSVKWTFNTATSAPILSSPAIASDGNVFFGGGDGRLWAVRDTGNAGTFQWKYPNGSSQPLPGAIRSSPLIAGSDHVVYFGCDDGKIYSVYSAAGLASTPWPMFRKDAAHTASTAPASISQPPWWISARVTGLPDIYKGITGFGVPYSGLTWFTLSRYGCASDINSSLQMTFFLGGDGSVFSTPYYDYKPWFAYDQLDFTASGCYKAPFPSGFYVVFQPGQTEVTITVETVDSPTYDDLQTLLLTIPTTYDYSPSPDAEQVSVTVHPHFEQ